MGWIFQFRVDNYQIWTGGFDRIMSKKFFAENARQQSQQEIQLTCPLPMLVPKLILIQ